MTEKNRLEIKDMERQLAALIHYCDVYGDYPINVIARNPTLQFVTMVVLDKEMLSSFLKEYPSSTPVVTEHGSDKYSTDYVLHRHPQNGWSIRYFTTYSLIHINIPMDIVKAAFKHLNVNLNKYGRLGEPIEHVDNVSWQGGYSAIVDQEAMTLLIDYFKNA